MSAEESKAVMRRLYEEVFNQGKVELADEIIAADCVDHNVDSPVAVPAGPGPIKGFVTFFRSAFPDAHWTIEDMVAEGDKVASLLILRGTNTGAYRGIPATGKKIELSGLVIFHVRDGQVVERWGGFDALGLLQQLGIAAEMGQQVGRPTGPPGGRPPGPPEDGASAQRRREMKMTENKALLERLYEEVFNKGNVDVADELISRESVDHSGEAPDLPDESEIGPERIKAMVNMLKAAFPDGHWTVEDMVEEGDLIGARVKIEGTHLGERFGMAPTGKRVKVYEMLQTRIRDGKLTEIWHQVDMLGMRQQLMGFQGGGGRPGGPPGGGPPGGGPPGGGPPGGRPGGGPPGGFPGGGPPGGFPGGGPPGGFPGGGPPGGFPGGGPPGGGPPGGFPGGGPPGGGPPGAGPGVEIPPGFTREPGAPPERRSAPDDKKGIMRELYDVVYTQGKLAVADELIAPGMVDHARPIAARNPDLVPKGSTPIKFFVHRFFESFPDVKWTTENVIEEGDRVMARIIATGTHQGEFEGIPPTGKRMEIAGLVIFRIENGMIAERWGEIDTLGLLQQLGARPAMGAGGPPR